MYLLMRLPDALELFHGDGISVLTDPSLLRAAERRLVGNLYVPADELEVVECAVEAPSPSDAERDLVRKLIPEILCAVAEARRGSL